MPVSAVLGIDLAEHKFDVALLVAGKTEHKVCRNSIEGFETLKQWLDEQGVELLHACIAATDGNGDELAVYLRRSGHRVSTVHPSIINEFAWSERLHSKMDKTDSFMVARFCQVMKPREWDPPLPEIRSLVDLGRRADSLVNVDDQERTRIRALNGYADSVIQGHIAFLDEGIEKLKFGSK
ncbi:Transposase [Syntrophus gentianae]|uniref:Transposase n=1 Tax=Syntrophus gentianae TaxID=43775 RepID=A0A1H8AQX7_9BACT|nr:transposase [Syntrophus gentianae]SEM72973.1 Transposase [Syntrophus gentianae]